MGQAIIQRGMQIKRIKLSIAYTFREIFGGRRSAHLLQYRSFVRAGAPALTPLRQ